MKRLFSGAPLILAALLAAPPASAQDTASVAAPAATPADSAARREGVRVCAGGDVTLGTNLDTTWVHTAAARLGPRVRALPSPDSLLAPLRPLLEDADVVLLNVEAAIGEGPPERRKCAPGSTACFAFRSPTSAAGALRRVRSGGEVVGNVANNHARDTGLGGWRTTQRHLRDAGVHVTGADTLATPVATAAGDTVAFLGYSAWIGPDVNDVASMRRHVRRAAERWRHVVVTMHAGAEGTGAQRTPDAVEVAFGERRGNSVAFARAALEAGADVVFGHGPHVMRGAEWYGRGLAFYSLGNLLTYGPFSFGEPLNRGALACVVFDEDGVASAELRSTVQSAPGWVRPDPTGRAAWLVESLSRADFPAGAPRVAASGELGRPTAGEFGGAPGGSAPRRKP
ncbi:MAG TPA: CapA family protein [Longimicrobium sp.]|nr:CapA family protein [Longimicrobium sp.]